MEYWEDETKHTYLSDFEETGHYKGEDLFMFASLSDKEDYSMNCLFKNCHEIEYSYNVQVKRNVRNLRNYYLKVPYMMMSEIAYTSIPIWMVT